MAEEAQQQTTEFEIQVPPELDPGAYANFLSIWHTPHEFTLDFAVSLPARTEDNVVKVPVRVVSRIRIPPTVILDVIQALSDNVAKYQQSFGEIQRPGPHGGGETTLDGTEDRPGAGGYH
jgi:hypothetical protein